MHLILIMKNSHLGCVVTGSSRGQSRHGQAVPRWAAIPSSSPGPTLGAWATTSDCHPISWRPALSSNADLSWIKVILKIPCEVVRVSCPSSYFKFWKKELERHLETQKLKGTLNKTGYGTETYVYIPNMISYLASQHRQRQMWCGY